MLVTTARRTSASNCYERFGEIADLCHGQPAGRRYVRSIRAVRGGRGSPGCLARMPNLERPIGKTANAQCPASLRFANAAVVRFPPGFARGPGPDALN